MEVILKPHFKMMLRFFCQGKVSITDQFSRSNSVRILVIKPDISFFIGSDENASFSFSAMNSQC